MDGALQLLPRTKIFSSLPPFLHSGRYRCLGPAGVRDLTQRMSSYWAEYTSRVRRYHRAARRFHSPQRPRLGLIRSHPHRPRHPPRRQARCLLHRPRAPTLPTSPNLPPFPLVTAICDRAKSLLVDRPPSCIVFCVTRYLHLHHLQLHPTRPAAARPASSVARQGRGSTRASSHSRSRAQGAPSAAELFTMH
jgi:hypothetical protein